MRTIVTTDPELDDLNSMLRLLLYSNELGFEGLVYTSSMFHWAGDLERGIEPHRWPPTDVPWHIHEALARYREVADRLRRHDRRYPAPEDLEALVALGNINAEGDMEARTAGSELIAEALLRGGSGCSCRRGVGSARSRAHCAASRRTTPIAATGRACTPRSWRAR